MKPMQIAGIALLAVPVVLYLAFAPGNKTRPPKPAPQDRPAPKIGTLERLRHELDEDLGESNRDAPRIRSLSESDGIVTVEFSINDNLGDSLIKTGARQDVSDILKSVDESAFPFRLVVCQGYFLLKDKFGKTEETKVIDATYSEETVNKIHWKDFSPKDVFDIADSADIHPAMR